MTKHVANWMCQTQTHSMRKCRCGEGWMDQALSFLRLDYTPDTCGHAARRMRETSVPECHVLSSKSDVEFLCSLAHVESYPSEV